MDEQNPAPSYSDVAARLSGSNEPPQPSDEAFLRGELERGRDVLVSFDEQIERLQAQQNEIRDKRNLTQQFVDDHECILSPFRRVVLPPEILTHIFHDVAPIVTTDVRDAIWLLGQVCSYWRSVLLSHSPLWSRFFVTNMCAPLVKEVLSRSKEAPLDLFITPTTDVDDQVLSTVLHIIVPVSHRWRTVSLENIPTSLLSLFSPAKGHIPVLTELLYDCPTLDPPDLAWLAEAPSLQKLHVYAEADQTELVSLSALHIPWSQLRECSINFDFFFWAGLPAQYQLELLRLCPNLERYTQVDTGTTKSFSSPDMVSMPKLRTLQTCIPNDLLQNLILPSLDHICLLSINQFEERSKASRTAVVSQFSALLSRSSCSLHTLQMSDLIEDSQLVIQILSEAPLHGLTALHVTYLHSGHRALVELLTIRPGDVCAILPRLEELHLHVALDTSSEITDSTLLVEMTRSRWQLGDEHTNKTARLTLLEYKSLCGYDTLPAASASIRAALFALRDEGLRIDVDSSWLKADMSEDCPPV